MDNNVIVDLVMRIQSLFAELENIPLRERIKAINEIRRNLHSHSPFSQEPVDCVQWIPANQVAANEYNPNKVAPPEMRLLLHSIEKDGFTQPIVAQHKGNDSFIVVDGFHRKKIAANTRLISDRLHGYVPVATIRSQQSHLVERMASTIRHNRARGIHSVMPMTSVVTTLLKNGWSDMDISTALGMDTDEVLRFKQTAGLPELFKDQSYSMSWE